MTGDRLSWYSTDYPLVLISRVGKTAKREQLILKVPRNSLDKHEYGLGQYKHILCYEYGSPMPSFPLVCKCFFSLFNAHILKTTEPNSTKLKATTYGDMVFQPTSYGFMMSYLGISK